MDIDKFDWDSLPVGASVSLIVHTDAEGKISYVADEPRMEDGSLAMEKTDD